MWMPKKETDCLVAENRPKTQFPYYKIFWGRQKKNRFAMWVHKKEKDCLVAETSSRNPIFPSQRSSNRTHGIGPMESDPWNRTHGIGPMESDPWKSKKKIPNKETKKNQ